MIAAAAHAAWPTVMSNRPPNGRPASSAAAPATTPTTAITAGTPR